MTEVKLAKRYPESRAEDITDAYMRGFAEGMKQSKPTREVEEKAPKWDAVVRCRDCKHHYERAVVNWRGDVFDTEFSCELMLDGFGEGDSRVTADHFCAWGERREL